MANVSRPRGAVPVATLSGSPWAQSVRQYAVASGNSTAVFRGDFMTLNDDGSVSPAAAGGILLGVCVGVKVDRSIAATEHPGYLPASTAGYVLVCVGPDVIYELQEDNTGGPMVATNVGSTGDMVAGAGSTTSGVSGHLLDSSDVIAKDGTPASAQLLVIGLSQKVDNAVGNDAKWLVRINESALALGQTGL